MKLFLKRLIGLYSIVAYADVAGCVRCYRRWRLGKQRNSRWLTVEPHFTMYSKSTGCFPLCKECWRTLTPETRLPFYRKLYDRWAKNGHSARPPFETIKDAVMNERGMSMEYIQEQIDHMPAGPELDELVEIHIYQSIPLTDGEIDIFKAAAAMSHGQTFREKIRLFKIQLSEPDYHTGLTFRLSWPRSWSLDGFGTSARELVNKMREDGWLFSLYEVPGSGVETLRIAAFEKMPQANMKGCQGKAEGNTDALAISRAALKAKLQDDALNKRGEK
jgi:hypothetical protein